ncbi:hypothetical protein FVE85_5910 [Porphyridium purpureum]|uniref:Uncharacterized protein n=1 Tax=Porphyridium purpureum TaxID=35688 RepID=A0A5J4Z4S3_PORPP|nr:hypothetical protein FVE85_5910 [Porphyridium purpureum]|eukprot:POR4887..scf295_1
MEHAQSEGDADVLKTAARSAGVAGLACQGNSQPSLRSRRTGPRAVRRRLSSVVVACSGSMSQVSKWRLCLYLLSLALFLKITVAQIQFHPPRPDAPDTVFGGRLVFLTVQTNLILTAYVTLCVLECAAVSTRAAKMIRWVLHVSSGVAFALGFCMGSLYYTLIHFDPHTRLRAAEIDQFDYHMHLLHGAPLLFVILDALLKERTFMESAPEGIVQALASLNTLSSLGSSQSLSQVSLADQQQQILRRRRGLLRMTRSVKRARRSFAVRLWQSDTLLVVLYGMFYLAFTLFCAYRNEGWMPYPFQQKLRPLQLSAVYVTLIFVLLPTLTLLARALRGRATQVVVQLRERRRSSRRAGAGKPSQLSKGLKPCDSAASLSSLASSMVA